MSTTDYSPIMVTVKSNDLQLLESLRALGPDIIRAGDVQAHRGVEDPKLNPSDLAQLAYQVIGVVGTIGGAARFVDWVIEKFKPARSTSPTFRIELGTVRIEVSDTMTPEQLRHLLFAHLKLPT